MAWETYLVRHGDYHQHGPRETRGTLTPLGIKQAEHARNLLSGLTVGNAAVVLSSDAPRAMETARIIGEGLKAEALPSKILRLAGEHADLIPSLQAVLTKAMEEVGLSPHNGIESLVVVNHAPLISIATGQDDIPHGEVVDYTHGSWHNPDCQDGGIAWKKILRENELA